MRHGAIVQHRGNRGVRPGSWRGYGSRLRNVSVFRREFRPGEQHRRRESSTHIGLDAPAGRQHAGGERGKGVGESENPWVRRAINRPSGVSSSTLIRRITCNTSAILCQPTMDAGARTSIRRIQSRRPIATDWPEQRVSSLGLGRQGTVSNRITGRSSAALCGVSTARGRSAYRATWWWDPTMARGSCVPCLTTVRRVAGDLRSTTKRRFQCGIADQARAPQGPAVGCDVSQRARHVERRSIVLRRGLSPCNLEGVRLRCDTMFS